MSDESRIPEVPPHPDEPKNPVEPAAAAEARIPELPPHPDAPEHPALVEPAAEPFHEADFTPAVAAARTGAEPRPIERNFEDLTLAELLGQFRRAPRLTWRMFATVLQPQPSLVPLRVAPAVTTTHTPTEAAWSRASEETRRRVVQLALYVVAVCVALVGNVLLLHTSAPGAVGDPLQPPAIPFSRGLPFLVIGVMLWVAGEVVGGRRKPDTTAIDTAVQVNRAGFNLVTLGIGVMLMGFAFVLNSDNRFTTFGVLAWLGSVVMIVMTFAPHNWNPLDAVSGIVGGWRRFVTGERLTLVALVMITLLAAVMRLQGLDTMLPEMTSDHVEKILDGERVREGMTAVFFPNNGGREPLQMYLMALLSQVPGFGINFMTLKVLAVIEAVLSIPVFWWMGREIIGERDRRLGNAVGLALALLIAVGYWHIAVTRVALRIILTPLVAALLMIYLARAMRHNRRSDFIKAGLVLGFGLYTYQATRMLPVVVVIGVGLALVFYARSWQTVRRYALNLAVLVLVAFTAFVPLFRYSVQYPDSFWNRASGRLFGETLIEQRDANGVVTGYRTATVEDQLAAFSANLPILGDNIVRALGMFNYRGDGTWLHSAQRYPAMDVLTGAFLIGGLAGWGVLMVRRRDPVYWLVPVALFVLLLPSALAIAQPAENPSLTRASGALPLAYLLAAFGCASIPLVIGQIVPRLAARRTAVVYGAGIALACGAMASWLVFNPYYTGVTRAWLPISQAGRILEGFAQSIGDYGNAYLLAGANFLDWRGVALEGGVSPLDWQNGDIQVANLPGVLANAAYSDTYRFQPGRDLLIFYPQDAPEIEQQLQAWFPEGRIQFIESKYISSGNGRHFKIMTVPALGAEAFVEFVRTNVPERGDYTLPAS